MGFSGFAYLSLLRAAGAVLLLCAVGCGGAHRTVVEPVSIPALPVDAEPAPGDPARAEEPGDEVIHVVQPGQTLWRIARAYGMSPEELAEANGIPDPTRVDAGTRLVIPGARVAREVAPGPAFPEPARSRSLSETAEARDWIWPVRGGEIISYFGAPRKGHRHGGIDLRGGHGERVVAARDGRVVYSGSGMRGYGKTVMIDHGDGFVTLYAHNSALLVREGDLVRRGDPIARVGRTGNASTDHCHFEIRRNDVPIDPLRVLYPSFKAER